MRQLFWFFAAVTLAGCAAHMHPLERGEWSLVWTAPGSQEQDVIPRATYEDEIANGAHRDVKFLTDEKAPVLADHEGPIALTLGTVGRFRLNEGASIQLSGDEAVFQAYWGDAKKVDTWEGDQAKTHLESQLFLRPTKVGKGKLKLADETWGTHEWDVTVSAAPKK
jgi:hypothetical protein